MQPLNAGGAGEQGQILYIALIAIQSNPEGAADLCEAAAVGDVDLLQTLIFSSIPDGPVEAKRRQAYDDPSSQPTSNFFVWDNPYYSVIEGFIPIHMVRAQDRAGPIYDEERFIEETLDLGSRYRGAGTGEPATYFAVEYSFGYYWPKAVPIPPAGSPFLNGR